VAANKQRHRRETHPIANAARAFNLALEGCDVAIQTAISHTVGTIAFTD
jgi:hypothetical protein